MKSPPPPPHHKPAVKQFTLSKGTDVSLCYSATMMLERISHNQGDENVLIIMGQAGRKQGWEQAALEQAACTTRMERTGSRDCISGPNPRSLLTHLAAQLMGWAEKRAGEIRRATLGRVHCAAMPSTDATEGQS